MAPLDNRYGGVIRRQTSPFEYTVAYYDGTVERGVDRSLLRPAPTGNDNQPVAAVARRRGHSSVPARAARAAETEAHRTRNLAQLEARARRERRQQRMDRVVGGRPAAGRARGRAASAGKARRKGKAKAKGKAKGKGSKARKGRKTSARGNNGNRKVQRHGGSDGVGSVDDAEAGDGAFSDDSIGSMDAPGGSVPAAQAWNPTLVTCPACDTVLLPPPDAPVFACPCGQHVVAPLPAANTTPVVFDGTGGGGGGGGDSQHGKATARNTDTSASGNTHRHGGRNDKSNGKGNTSGHGGGATTQGRMPPRVFLRRRDARSANRSAFLATGADIRASAGASFAAVSASEAAATPQQRPAQPSVAKSEVPTDASRQASTLLTSSPAALFVDLLETACSNLRYTLEPVDLAEAKRRIREEWTLAIVRRVCGDVCG